MNKYIKYAFALALPTVVLSSCDDYLDTMPDNRADLNTEENIQTLLVSAYPTKAYCYVAELSSDNCDDQGLNNPYTDRWAEDTFAYKDEIESDNESLEDFWEASYSAIGSANEAIYAIEKLGGPTATKTLSQLRGEALLCRAYNHFMLANMFCKNWTQNAADDLGLPYMETLETTLLPKYERGTLADFYDKIERDLEEGLQLVSDSYYTVPKYHFNKSAAYAFASRFYLYTEQWQKAIDAANVCLGSQPEAVLRDWAAMAAMPQQREAICNEYINAMSNANLLLLAPSSALGLTFGPYYVNCRFNHNSYLANNEDMDADNIFGSGRQIRMGSKSYSASNLNKTIFWRCPYLFEYTDIVAQIGIRRTVFPAFTTDETLLNRAEAYIMLNQYANGAKDLTTWMKNFTVSTTDLTPEYIQSFYNSAEYAYSDELGIESTIKKHLNPAFAIDAEGSVQECMLQCVLGFRRLETMHVGIRWFDIKRYGIEIPRRVMNPAGKPAYKTDVLTKDDKRRAFQIPLKVRDAGLTPNDR